MALQIQSYYIMRNRIWFRLMPPRLHLRMPYAGHRQAYVYTVKEWKKTKYAGKTKPMADGIADVDMALEKTLLFE